MQVTCCPPEALSAHSIPQSYTPVKLETQKGNFCSHSVFSSATSFLLKKKRFDQSVLCTHHFPFMSSQYEATLSIHSLPLCCCFLRESVAGWVTFLYFTDHQGLQAEKHCAKGYRKELKDEHVSEASLNFQDTDIKEFTHLFLQCSCI